MKCLGTFIVLAILNLIGVLAGPPQNIYINSGDFEYYIPGGTDFVIANKPLKNTAKKLTVRPYVIYNNKRYYTKYFSAYFRDSDVERIVFPSSIKKEIFLGSGFETAKKLKAIQIDTPYARIGTDYADKVDINVAIEGKGVEGMMFEYAREMLKQKNISLTKYNANNYYQMRCNLLKVAKYMNDNFNYKYSCRYNENCDSGTHTLLYKKGGEYGFARAFRILAIAAGYDRNAVQVGGDNMMFAFNYLEFNKKWYLIEVHGHEYKNGESCNNIFNGSDLVTSHNGYYGKGVSLTDDVLTIYHDMFGYEGEVSEPKQENFKQWLKKNNKGTLVKHY
eukprot:jgi/Orpsp1_1/1177171/evm.model.c7180000060449.2